ncbi:MAG: trypsin-like peptidase domain-containing protein [Acidobacteria bacterium]|nr:trypsin-like peptidase domain-containing protein [Acidobacteriota bacterium]
MRVFSLGVLLVMGCAFAIGGPPSSQLLTNGSAENQGLASVARLRAGFTCGATWIDAGGGSDSPAYLLTSGHCVSLEPYGVITDRAVTYQAEFHYFVDTRAGAVTVPVTRVVWSTMKLTDLAVLQLAWTVGEMQAQGLTPHRLARTVPPPGAPVYWVGAPTNFIPTGQTFLRKGDCSALGLTAVVEGRWIWPEQIRNDCPEVYASASGSPLFDAGTNEIAGVIGTTTLLSTHGGEDFDCFQNRPCALGRDGTVVEQHTSYASPVGGLLGCFQDGRFDLTLPSCPLDRGVQLAIDIGRASAMQPPGQWQARFSGDLRYYATRLVRLADLNACFDAVGYSATRALSDATVFEAPVGNEEGDYLLCVIAGNSPAIDGTWQPARHASIRRMRLDARPMTAIPDYEVTDAGFGYRLTFGQQAPATGALDFKRGGLSETDCADPAGYRPMFSPPQLIRTSEYPHRVCVRIADEAGNSSPPMAFDFGPPALEPFAVRNHASWLRTRQVARGSLLRLHGMELSEGAVYASPPAGELAGVRLDLVDSAGARHQLLLYGVSTTSVEALIPAAAMLGEAELVLSPANRAALRTSIEVTQSSPGMYASNFLGFGQPLAYFQLPDSAPMPVFACRPDNSFCQDLPIPVSGRESIELLVSGTGLSGVTGARIGTESVDVIGVSANADWPGIEMMRLRIPPDFPLRGYQLIWVGEQNLRLLFE